MKLVWLASTHVTQRARALSSLLVLSTALLGAACSPRRAPSANEANAEALAAYEIDRLPKEGVVPALVDFGGKVHLVGYELQPSDSVRPGGSLKLKLYWRSVAQLGPGFRLTTYLLSGSRVDTFESVGALRKDANAGPSAWRRGKIYVDEHDIEIPAELEAKEVTIAVGVTRDALPKPEPEKAEETPPSTEGAEPAPQITHPPLRLPVLSGASDGNERAVIAHLRNDVAAKVAPRARRMPGDPSRRPPRAASSAR